MMATSSSTDLGGEIEGPLHYLLLSVGVSVGVIVLKSVGYAVGGPSLLFTSWLAIVLLLAVTGVLAVKTSKAGGGVLVSVLVVFLPVAAEREFNIVLGIGHPNPGVLYGAALALAVAVPVGGLGYLIGQRW